MSPISYFRPHTITRTSTRWMAYYPCGGCPEAREHPPSQAWYRSRAQMPTQPLENAEHREFADADALTSATLACVPEPRPGQTSTHAAIRQPYRVHPAITLCLAWLHGMNGIDAKSKSNPDSRSQSRQRCKRTTFTCAVLRRTLKTAMTKHRHMSM
jgi:hypothetical protein